MHRRTGGLLLITCLAACTTSSGVTATGAQPVHTVAGSVETTAPGVEPSVSTAPDGSESTLPTESTTLPTRPGDHGIGDRLFPSLGNPGIDVEHYTLRLDYDAISNELSGTAHLEMVMTEDRESFSLDSDGPTVSAVTVDGQPAEFEAAPPELLITPASELSSGQRVAVDVAYSISPQAVPSPASGSVGWFPTPGGSFVLNEPDGARTWLPCDDHPSDQATFRFELTVPSGVTAVANGDLIDHTTTASGETWTWEEDRPMATYLIQVLTGDYELIEGVGPDGLPLHSAVLREDRERMQSYLDTIDDQIDFLDDYFGPYPLDSYGIAMADSVPGIAMETFGRPMFSRTDFLSGRLDPIAEMLLSHELAHQWFGNAVTPLTWTDIWLNESFATYGEWMWVDHIGLESIEGSADSALAAREPGSTASPSVSEMFGFNSYDGGAVVLHALRTTIGDDAFFTLLQRWVAENNGTARSTDDFVALASEVAGQDLADFFATWLYAATVPRHFPT